MNIPELIGYPLVVLARVVNNDGQQEGSVGCDQVRPVNGQLPFETKVPFHTIVRVPRDDRYEQGTGFDLLADRLVPDVPTPKRALVKPDLDTGAAQGRCYPLGGCGVL